MGGRSCTKIALSTISKNFKFPIEKKHRNIHFPFHKPQLSYTIIHHIAQIWIYCGQIKALARSLIIYTP